MNPTVETWMPEARNLAEQCWKRESTKYLPLDPVVQESFARCISSWMSDCAQAHRNAEYYRGLVVRCGKAIGDSAYIADDGGRSDDVLCAKVPELVEKMAKKSIPMSA